jgi:hypothetical protein
MKKIFGDTTSIGGITTTTQRTAESPQVLSISGTTSPTTTAQRGGQLVVKQTVMEPTISLNLIRLSG